MPHRGYDEEEWLDLFLTQRRYPDWTLDLQEAYYDAFEGFPGWRQDEDSAHKHACRCLKTGRNPAKRRSKLAEAVINNTTLQENTEAQIDRLITRILEHKEEIQNLSLEEKREIIAQALQDADDRKLPSPQLSRWLRYTYWTDEEAVLFALGSKSHSEYSQLLTKVKSATVFRNSDGDIQPFKFCDWVTGESRNLIFRRSDLEIMDPKSVDAMNVKRMTKVYDLLLALIEQNYGPCDISPMLLSKACLRAGRPISQDTIKAIVDEAKEKTSPVDV